MGTQMNHVVSIESLSRTFSGNNALNNIHLNFKSGCIHGLVGENGAGKSTLIKHLLGLYCAQQGTVRVFGLDPVRAPTEVLGQIGYVSEEPELPGWMSVSEYLNYLSAFYANWDTQFANQLLINYEIDPKKKNNELSKGQRARVALCAAQAHRPRLLLLDEPSSGLDPIVRQEILNVAIKTVKQDGRTVIFSSHLLEEVESISDQLIMIKKGKILLSDSLSHITQNHYQISFDPSLEEAVIKQIPHIFSIQKTRENVVVNCFVQGDILETYLKDNQIPIRHRKQLNLSEVFFARSQNHDNFELECK